MNDDKELRKGLRWQEMKLIFTLFPVFRRYLKDRETAKRDMDNENPWSDKRERNGEKALAAFVKLGPTFIKLGQALSARPDLLPREYLRSFEKLQDEVPPAPFDQVKPIIERNLGNIDKTFQNFDPGPVSAASLGQVYLAEYNGKQVAIKVNRPNISFVVQRDLLILSRTLRLLRGIIDNFIYVSVENVIRDFSARIYDEIDYTKEASNLKRIRKNIVEREGVIIPNVLDELSGKEVMVMEYIPGTKIIDVDSLRKKGFDLKSLAWKVDLVFMRMLLRDDIFHADPHPGNISVNDDGKLILYDFGMVGQLDKKTRFDMLSMYDGLLNSDPDEIMDSLVSIGALSPVANRAIIRKGIQMGIMSFQGRNPEETEISELLEIANGVIFEFPFRLPRSLVLYMRMSSILEGVCERLDPDFKFIKILREILYNEGLLNELYSEQLKEYFRKAVVSVQKGFDLIPLMKEYIEERKNIMPEKKDIRIPAAIFLSAIIVSATISIKSYPIESLAALILSMMGFVYIILKK